MQNIGSERGSPFSGFCFVDGGVLIDLVEMVVARKQRLSWRSVELYACIAYAIFYEGFVVWRSSITSNGSFLLEFLVVVDVFLKKKYEWEFQGA